MSPSRQAVGIVRLWVLERAPLQLACARLADTKWQRQLSAVDCLPLAAYMSDAEKKQLACALEPVTYAADEVIFRQLDVGTHCYFIVVVRAVASSAVSALSEACHCCRHRCPALVCCTCRVALCLWSS